MKKLKINTKKSPYSSIKNQQFVLLKAMQILLSKN